MRNKYLFFLSLTYIGYFTHKIFFFYDFYSKSSFALNNKINLFNHMNDSFGIFFITLGIISSLFLFSKYYKYALLFIIFLIINLQNKFIININAGDIILLTNSILLLFPKGRSIICINMLAIYFITGLYKFTEPSWVKGEALYLIMQADIMTTSLGSFLKNQKHLFIFLNYLTLLLEIISPIFIFLSTKYRNKYLIILTGFHFGILALINVGFFPLIMISFLIVSLNQEIDKKTLLLVIIFHIMTIFFSKDARIFTKYKLFHKPILFDAYIIFKGHSNKNLFNNRTIDLKESPSINHFGSFLWRKTFKNLLYSSNQLGLEKYAHFLCKKHKEKNISIYLVKENHFTNQNKIKKLKQINCY